ncbi:hypothetical protein APS58_p00028 (plasmid) [Paracidovorax citrulli]|nr:hypothetical protein APS58_p00028 [Paracidovorax citrulli]
MGARAAAQAAAWSAAQGPGEQLGGAEPLQRSGPRPAPAHSPRNKRRTQEGRQQRRATASPPDPARAERPTPAQPALIARMRSWHEVAMAWPPARPRACSCRSAGSPGGRQACAAGDGAAFPQEGKRSAQRPPGRGGVMGWKPARGETPQVARCEARQPGPEAQRRETRAG